MIDIDITDIIRTQFQIDQSTMYTAIPCTVVNVVDNMQTQRVDVLPSINDLRKDGTGEPGMQILGVPVILPGSQSTLISFPINVGDTVLCIFSQRSMDNFKIGNGQPTTANDYRKFSDQDAIAIPGLFPFSKSLNRTAVRKFPFSPNRDLSMAHNVGSGTENTIILKQSGDIEITTGQNVKINCVDATVTSTGNATIDANTVNVTAGSGDFQIGTSTWNGNMNITGTWTFNGIPFNTHKHTGVTPGSGTSGGPTA